MRAMKILSGFGFVMIALLCAIPLRADTNSPAPPELKILSRAEWGAKPPVSAMPSNFPVRITIHHTATLQKQERPLKDKLVALQIYSQREDKLANGKTKPVWPDVPYHFYIDCKGDVAEGRELAFTGDTNTEYDTAGHAIVVLEGNFEQEQPNENQ